MLDRVEWNTACLDWADRIVEGRSLIPNLPLFEEEAARALRVFKRLRVPDLVGTPTYGEVCGEWVFDLVRAIFGSYDPETRRRMIREFFLLIPKKNGKSSIAAAIMVTAAIVNRRPAAELLLIAPTKKIADIAYKQAAGIIKLDPELTKIFHTKAHERTILHRLTDAMILIKAADADVITGSKATFILIDETHVFSLKAKAHAIFTEIRGSLASRTDGFLLQITTQSKDPPAGVFKTELNIARDVRDGLIKLPLLPILYELPLAIAKDGGWKDRKTWGLVNPNLNRSVDEAFLADEVLKAEREGGEALSLLASQHFNVEVGLALRNDGWSGAADWEKCGDKNLTLDVLLKRAEVITVGIDGGGRDDLLGLAIIGREKVTRKWLLWSHAFAHRIVLERRKDIAQNLLDYEKEGSLTFSTSTTENIAALINIVLRCKEARLLPEENAIGIDPNNAGDIFEGLSHNDLGDKAIKRLLQGPALAPALYGFDIKLDDATLIHDGSEMMKWVVGNVKIEMHQRGPMATKRAAGSAKIDPFIAAEQAGLLMSWNPMPKSVAAYQMIIV